MPKSTCHTSPRSGTRGVLLLIQRAERSRSQSREIVICQVIRYGNTFDNCAPNLPALRLGELLERANNLGDSLCHRPNIHGSNELGKQLPQ